MRYALSRRSLISGSAVLAAAAATAAVPAAALPAVAAAPETLSENASLLTLGDRIEPLLSAYRAASERKRAARDLAEELCPPLPDDLVRKREDRITFAGATERERDVEGKEVWESFEGDGSRNAPPRQIIKAELERFPFKWTIS